MGRIGRILVVWALGSGCLESPSDPPTPEEACGTLSSLTDEFEGGLSTWRWYAEGLWGADSAAIQLTPSPETASAIYSQEFWMVEGGDLVVQFDISGMAPDSLVELWLSGEEGEVNLSLEDEVLRAGVFQPGFEGTRDSVAFDPAMRWWRIGRAGGRMQWATSTDGTTWVDQGEFDADLAGLAEVAIVHIARGTPSAVTVEAINPGGASQPTCPLDSFRDDFSDPDPRWEILAEAICEVNIAERAEIGLMAAEACGLFSRERFSLVDSEVSIEMADAGDCRLSPTLQVNYDGTTMAMSCLAGSPPLLVAVVYGEDFGEDRGSADFDPEAFRYWRLRHAPDQGGLLFETSPDRTEWNQLGLWDDVDDARLTSVEVALIVSSEEPVSGTVAFDELNAAP